MERLEAKNVRYEYRTKLQVVRAVNGVSCVFEPGRVYAVVGASGCGKTTFLSLLAGLDVPAGGTIEFDGSSTADLDRDAYRLEHVSVIYQNFNLFYHLTVLENAAYPLYVKKMPKKEADEIARQMLVRVGLTPEQLSRMPNMLSGGEQQRVAIARALASGTELILADEPTGNLDSKNSQEVLALLQTMSAKYQQTILMITHNKNHASAADRIFNMSDGVLKELGASRK